MSSASHSGSSSLSQRPQSQQLLSSSGLRGPKAAHPSVLAALSGLQVPLDALLVNYREQLLTHLAVLRLRLHLVTIDHMAAVWVRTCPRSLGPPCPADCSLDRQSLSRMNRPVRAILDRLRDVWLDANSRCHREPNASWVRGGPGRSSMGIGWCGPIGIRAHATRSRQARPLADIRSYFGSSLSSTNRRRQSLRESFEGGSEPG